MPIQMLRTFENENRLCILKYEDEELISGHQINGLFPFSN